MELFLSFSVDLLSQEFTRATLEDDADKLRRMNQAMERGNKIWESWVLSFGCSVVTLGFGVGILQVAADRLSEVSRIRDEAASAYGEDVSVGIGQRISEAEKALKAAKLSGGDKIVLYDDQVEETLAEADKRSNTEDIIGKILNKNEELIYSQLMKGLPAQVSAQGPYSPGSEASISSSMSSPAMQQGSGAGMAGAAGPAHPAAPMGEASEHSQGEAMANVMENDNPPPAEGTHSAHEADEDSLHQVAEGQEKEDKEKDDAEQEGDSHIAAIKQQVVKVLEQVKAQAQILEEIKKQAPEVYKTIMGMVQAVILMAREMNKDAKDDEGEEDKDQDIQKSEVDWENLEFADPLEKSVKDVRLGQPLDIATLSPKMQKVWGPRLAHAPHYDYTHVLPPETQAEGYRLILGMGQPTGRGTNVDANVIHNDDPLCGGVSGTMKWSDVFNEPILRVIFTQIHGEHQGKGLGKACYKALYSHAHNKFGIKRVAGAAHSTGASAVHQSVSRELGLDYKPKKNITVAGEYNSESQWESAPSGNFDDKFRPYNYQLKGEMPISKAELMKMAVDSAPTAAEGHMANKWAKSEEGFDPDELAMGSEEEMEHTDDESEAAEIAKDHLREDPKYYSKLKAAGLVKYDEDAWYSPSGDTYGWWIAPDGQTIDLDKGTSENPHSEHLPLFDWAQKNGVPWAVSEKDPDRGNDNAFEWAVGNGFVRAIRGAKEGQGGVEMWKPMTEQQRSSVGKLWGNFGHIDINQRDLPFINERTAYFSSNPDAAKYWTGCWKNQPHTLDIPVGSNPSRVLDEAHKHLSVHPLAEKMDAAAYGKFAPKIEKAGPMPSTPKRRSHIIPGMQIPGAQKDCAADSTGKRGEAGVFVVKDAGSGKNKKKQGLAGVIMGQSGPTSSLTPDG